MKQLFIAASFVLLLVIPVFAQDVESANAEKLIQVAPIYSLPEDGTWVNYDILYVDPKGRPTDGVMQVSSVGRPSVRGERCRWIEVSINAVGMVQRTGSFLIQEDAYLKRGSLENSVIEAYHREGPQGSVRRLEGRELAEYFTMGIRGDLKQVSSSQDFVTGLGTVSTRNYSTHGFRRLGSPANGSTDGGSTIDEQEREEPLEYRCWLSDEVPFGIARFEVWATVPSDNAAETEGKLLFRATAKEAGDNSQPKMPRQ